MVLSWSLVTSMTNSIEAGSDALITIVSKISPASLDIEMNGMSVGMFPPFAATSES